MAQIGFWRQEATATGSAATPYCERPSDQHLVHLAREILMRIINFIQGGKRRLGFEAGDTVIDALSAAHAAKSALVDAFADTISFIESGDSGLAEAKKLIASAPASAKLALSSAKLTSPIMPTTILGSGSNYTEHNAEKANVPISGKEVEFFIKASDCVVGSGDPIIYNPKLTKKLDCETELAVVIGKPGRNIPVEKALDHVFGYTIVDDVSARDLQVRKSPEGFVWYETGRGKSFDSAAPLGPAIVTADEIEDPQALKLQTRINGELRQSTNTSLMIFSCARIIHHFSISFRLRPGMVILTGTPGGTAWSVDPELGGSGRTRQVSFLPAAIASRVTLSKMRSRRSASCATQSFILIICRTYKARFTGSAEGQASTRPIHRRQAQTFDQTGAGASTPCRFDRFIGRMIMIRTAGVLKPFIVVAGVALVQPGFAAEPFRVGWNAELSGPWAFTGGTCLAAAQMAENEVNAGGKIIELVVQDNQTNPAQAAAVARALDTQEKVDLMSGPTQADVSLAVYGYAEQAKIPYLVPVAAFPQLTKPGTKYTYRMEPDAVGWGYALVKFIQEMKPDATVGIMVNDFAINRAILAGFKYQAEKDGLKIVGETVFPQTASDTTVQTAQMKGLNPDYVLVGGGATAFDATLTTQLLDIGFKPEQLIHPFGSTKQVLNWTDRSVGSYFGTFFDKSLPNLTDAGRKFVDNFRAEKGYTPGYVENYCYTTVWFIGQMVQAGATDRESIQKAIIGAKTKELTTDVPIFFDANGARSAYMYLLQIQGMTKDDFTGGNSQYIEWSPEVLPVYDLVK